MKDTVARTVTVSAVDLTFGTMITRAGNYQDLEIIQLEYYTGTNSSAAEFIFQLLPPVAPTEANGTWDTTEVTAYTVSAGTGAITSTNPVTLWPAHAKLNLAGRMILPAGWALIATVVSANMNGTVIVKSITREIDA